LVYSLIISPALWVQLVSQLSASVGEVETLRYSGQSVLVLGIVNNLQPVGIFIRKDRVQRRLNAVIYTSVDQTDNIDMQWDSGCRSKIRGSNELILRGNIASQGGNVVATIRLSPEA
jgi:hypothetical protein